ncbi:MAG TPA: histidine phosphatase family protein [Candidatus Absconditabacterales bacterium]|nr:histidine phosphatase family protein [Candidatus Absconditabacterales bacterium]HNG97306.1 histidine phosphatase family protein [Candidatus Absconditabacterales bacterium]
MKKFNHQNTTLFVVRHGENEDNVQGILNGHRDFGLTEKGKDQATKAGEKIKALGLTIDHHYSSPLLRAQQTAHIISTTSGVMFAHIEPDLIERDFGDLTGKPVSQLPTHYQKDDYMITRHVTYYPNPNNGESFDQCIERAKTLIQKLCNQHPGQSILLTCHGDIGKCIYSAWHDLHWSEGLTQFNFDNGVILHLDNYKDHNNVILG